MSPLVNQVPNMDQQLFLAVEPSSKSLPLLRVTFTTSITSGIQIPLALLHSSRQLAVNADKLLQWHFDEVLMNSLHLLWPTQRVRLLSYVEGAEEGCIR